MAKVRGIAIERNSRGIFIQKTTPFKDEVLENGLKTVEQMPVFFTNPGFIGRNKKLVDINCKSDLYL